MTHFRRVTYRKVVITLCCVCQLLMVVFQIVTYNNLYPKQEPSFHHKEKTPAPARRGDILQDHNLLQTSCQEYFDNFKTSRLQLHALQLIRIYNKCFLQNQFMLSVPSSTIEQQLFPYLNFKLPVYTRWNNETYQIPITPNSNAGFWSQFQQKLKGDGIIISIYDNPDNIEQARSLLHVLRFLGNELPIQFIHKGDLSLSNQQLLINAARQCDIEDILEQVNYTTSRDHNQQDVWFVDVSQTIKQDYHAKFSHFANKWIPMLFSSFQRVIIMDTDVVPFVKPSQLLNSTHSNGKLWFFHDRNLPEFIHPTSLQYYLLLLPSNFEQLNFSITPVSTQFLEENPFFQLGQKHLMDSGLAIMNRTAQNLGGLLTSVNLQMDRRTSTPVYGDKELFWLGQVVAGNHDSFTFNQYSAAAIGKLEVGPNKLCSTQMAHFEPRQNEQPRLLWTNGCLNKCKKYNYNTWFRAWDTMWHPGLLIQHELSLSKIQLFYNKPVELKHGLIPSESPKVMSIRNLKAMAGTNFRKDKSLGCHGYFYCAYMDDESSLDTKSASTTKSVLIEFKGEYYKFINQVVRVWNSNKQLIIDSPL